MQASSREGGPNIGFGTPFSADDDTQYFENTPRYLKNVNPQDHMRSFCRHMKFSPHASVQVKRVVLANFGVFARSIACEATANDKYNLEW